MTAELEKIMIEERNEGIAEGRAEGRISELIALVSEGILTVSQAASRLGESEEAFSERLDMGIQNHYNYSFKPQV